MKCIVTNNIEVIECHCVCLVNTMCTYAHFSHIYEPLSRSPSLTCAYQHLHIFSSVERFAEEIDTLLEITMRSNLVEKLSMALYDCLFEEDDDNCSNSNSVQESKVRYYSFICMMIRCVVEIEIETGLLSISTAITHENVVNMYGFPPFFVPSILFMVLVFFFYGSNCVL